MRTALAIVAVYGAALAVGVPGARAADAIKPGGAGLMAEVQAIVDGGADPTRLARIISAHASEPDALLARKTALYVLKGVRPPSARLAALIEAGGSTTVDPEDDALWPELIGALSEAWSFEAVASGERRMLREPQPRTRRLLVSSLARYGASNFGLTELSRAQMRALAVALGRIRAKVPEEQRRDIDVAIAKLMQRRREIP